MLNLSIFLEGMLAAMVMGLFIVVFEVIKLSNLNLMLLIGSFFVRKSRDKALATSLGWVIHLVIGGLMAELYFFILTSKMVTFEFSLMSSIIWSSILWIVTMFVVMPILEGGIFAVKFGKFKWFELLIVFAAYGFSLHYLMLSLLAV